MKTSTVNLDDKIVKLLREYKQLGIISNIGEFVKHSIIESIYTLNSSEVVERYKKYCKRQIASKFREKEAEFILGILFNLDVKFIEDIDKLNVALFDEIEKLYSMQNAKKKYNLYGLHCFIEDCERFAKNYKKIKSFENAVLYHGAPLNSEELKEYADTAFDPFDDEDFDE